MSRRVGREVSAVVSRRMKRGPRLVWHRPDRGSPGLRFSSAGDAIWYPVDCHGPVWRLEACTGEIVAKLKGVEDVFESQFSDCRMESRRDYLFVHGAREFRVSRLTFAVLDATFSDDALCVSESRGASSLLRLPLRRGALAVRAAQWKPRNQAFLRRGEPVFLRDRMGIRPQSKSCRACETVFSGNRCVSPCMSPGQLSI